MHGWFHDLRCAARLLGRSPGFSLTVALVLALGIGANVTVFSFVDSVLLRPLSFKHQDRLVMIWQSSPKAGMGLAPMPRAVFHEWKLRSQFFEEMGAIATGSFTTGNLVLNGRPEQVQIAEASTGLLPVLGISPIYGRNFLPEEDVPGGPAVILVSHRFWNRSLGGRPEVVGTTVRLDGASRTIVGILPTELDRLLSADVWRPARIRATSGGVTGSFARLRPSVPRRQAQAELDAIRAELVEARPELKDGSRALVLPLRLGVSQDMGTALWILLGAAGCLLLLACANVGNLLLARASSRQKDVAVRMALGAGRARIIRQLLVESVLLAGVGGALGWLAAAWGVSLLRPLAPSILPAFREVRMDERIALFAVAVSLLTGILFGLAPALRSSSGGLSQSLKEAAGRGSLTFGRRGGQMALLVAQISLAVVLTAGAGLMARSLANLFSVDPGFSVDRLLTMDLTLPSLQYKDRAARRLFVDKLLERVRAAPGVESAGVINYLPLFSGLALQLRFRGTPFYVAGSPAPKPGEEPLADSRTVSPGYFETMGIPVRSGRVFNEGDRTDTPAVVAINQTLAKRCFPGEDPVGKRLVVLSAFDPGIRQIVGVVGDVKLHGLDEPIGPAIYTPHTQYPITWVSLVVRTAAANPAIVSESVRRAVAEVNPEQAVSNVQTMEQRRDASAIRYHLTAFLIASFAGMALLLAILGVYGLTSYVISLRIREFGLRMALGAGRSDLFRMVVSGGIFVTAAGVAIGLVGALGLTRLMRSLLFGVSATDATVFGLVALLLIAATAVACYLPARRAANVDPAVALRHE
jgi:putative ABC transport system permease protein